MKIKIDIVIVNETLGKEDIPLEKIFAVKEAIKEYQKNWNCSKYMIIMWRVKQMEKVKTA